MNASEQKTSVKKRIMKGTVVSSKMDKAIVVRIDYRIQHPLFKKFVTRSKRIMAHDETNSAHEGDFVSIESCRPVSKNKRFKLSEIVKKSQNTQGVEV